MRRPRIILLLLTFSLFIGVGSRGGAAPPPVASLKVQPALRRLSAQYPDAMVPVVVQLERGRQLHTDDLPEGGSMTREIRFINAYALQIPTTALDRLAANPKVRFISYDAPILPTELYQPVTAYPYATAVTDGLWQEGYAGQGIGVAVIDTGVANHPDLDGRVTQVNLGAQYGSADTNGHGTHVAGIVAGRSPTGMYIGMAPQARIYGLRVVGADGSMRESDLLAALQWVYENHQSSNIRVINISLQSSLAQSYRTSAISAAIEQLWLGGIVIVVSAGNRGTQADSMYYPPANDPYVITVGALNDNGTPDRSDDTAAAWSSRGVTQDGFSKPEILAPGRHIVAPLAPGSYLAGKGAGAIVDGNHIRLSGSSMAAPVVAGLAAAVLSYNPALTPDQLKWLLTTHTYGADFRAVDARLLWRSVKDKPLDQIPSANLGLTPNDQLTGAVTSETSVFDGSMYENVLFENVLFENVLFEN